MKNRISAFIAGPSNNGKHNLYKFGHISEEGYGSYINNMASLLNETAHTIGVLPDVGVPLDIAKALHSIPNRQVRIVGYYPKHGNTDTIIGNFVYCDETIQIDGGWAEMNTQPSKNFDVMVCCGFSAGVFTEIAHTKVHRLWSNKRVYVFIDERVISNHINIELESDVDVMYFDSDKTFVECINKIEEGK